MKKITLILALLIIFTSCALKHTQKLVHSGDYDNAISIAVSSLASNKDKKSKQEYVSLLEEAFAKAKERDVNAIQLLEKEGNPAQIEKIYQTYVQLNYRQEKIKPLLEEQSKKREQKREEIKEARAKQEKKSREDRSKMKDEMEKNQAEMKKSLTKIGIFFYKKKKLLKINKFFLLR